MNTKKNNLMGQSSTHAHKKNLRYFIRLALVGSILASGMAEAVLQDRGPSDPNLTWPLWYRDTNGLAVGECLSQVPSPNTLAGGKPMCFPFAFNPAGFPGNIGPEIFYNMVGFVDKNTGSDFHFRYVAGLEGSYLPLGVPVHGTETVFARVRIGLNFNDPAKNGTYTVTHPYGVETFQNVKATNTLNLFGKGTAIFFTADIPLAAVMNFDGALKGAIGPFVQWDVLQAGESLTTADGTTFLGDPNFPHTFTGSPFGTNFIRIDGPLGANLDGLGHNFIQINTATILGQVWSAPIAQALRIDSAYETRSTGANGINSIDVWATSGPNEKLIVTGTSMPSLQLFPDGTTPGKYHGHIEYSGLKVPSTVTVTNLTSIPVVSVSAALTDGVEISQASFDTISRTLTIVAASTDQVENPSLVVEGIPGVPSAAGVVPAVTNTMTQLACPATVTNPADRCFVYILPATIEPPENVSVVSSDLGAHADHLVSIVGAPQNPLNPPVASDFIGTNGFTVVSSGTTPLLNAIGSLPLDALIIAQPASGNITLVNGQWIFTATVGAIPGPDSFQYVKQALAPSLAVSNVATGNLTLTFQSAAPTAILDQFAATTNPAGARKLFILSNDKAASTNPADVINPASLTIVVPPTHGTASTNADGTISYLATLGGADSFTYTVSNSATPTAQTSNIATVQLTNFTGPESVSVSKVNYTIAQSKWLVTGGTNWFGPNLTQATATCWVGTGATPTAATLIGSAPIDTTGKYQIATVGGNTPVGTNNQPVTCQSSNGGKGVGTTVAK